MRGAGKDSFPREFGFVFMGFGLALMAAAWSLAAAHFFTAHFFTARFLTRRRHYWFCVVVSGLTCVVCMLNTGVAGITSLVILLQRGMRETFEAGGVAPMPEQP